MDGWIKLHRTIFNNPYMQKPAYLAVWIWLLAHAEHGMKFGKNLNKWVKKEEKDFPSVIWMGKRRYLKRGEVTYGAKRIGKEIHVPRGTVERIITLLKSEEQIEVETSNRFSLARVLNWDKYQISEEPVRNQRGTSEDVTKNDKNVKNFNGENSRAILTHWNSVYGTSLKSVKGFEANLTYWLEDYTLDDIKLAITNSKADPYWKGILDPVMFFRRLNPRREPMDNIGKYLNYKLPVRTESVTENVMRAKGLL